MSSSLSLTSIDVSEYDRIEAAMSESERGRWFLDAYLQRNRTHETGILLDAIARLEAVVTGDRDGDRMDRLRGDVMDMAHAIARTKAEIAAIHAPDQDQSRLGGASAALDAIVRSTERATSDILGAAEQVQEAAWTLRESGSDMGICDELDRRATAIYTACSFQDLTAQRTARIIHTLRYLEERLAAMMGIWGDALEPVPAAPGAARAVEVPADLCQSDVDRYIDMDAAPAEPDPSAVVAATDRATDVGIATVDASEVASEVALASEAVLDAPSDAVPETDETFAEPESEAEPESDAEPPENRDDTPPAAGVQPERGEPEASEDDLIDAIAQKIASAAPPAAEPTDVASAFAEIDGLSEDERRALFS